MLEIKSLNWSPNIVITSNSLLTIFSIICISKFHFIIIIFKTNWGQIKSEYCLRLLKANRNTHLKILHCQCFRIFLFCDLPLFFWLCLRISLWFRTWHKLRSLLKIWTASFHLRIILNEGKFTCEFKELLTFASIWSLYFLNYSYLVSRIFKYSYVYSLYFSVMRLKNKTNCTL